MTLNKAILGLVIIIASVFGVLAFGNPQWGKQIFIFQAYVWPAKDSGLLYVTENPDLIEPPHGFRGHWYIWDRDGDLFQISNVVDDRTQELVYFLPSLYDRRAEFGIEVE